MCADDPNPGRQYIAGTGAVSGADWEDIRKNSSTSPTIWSTIVARILTVYTALSTRFAGLVVVHGESDATDDCNKKQTGLGCGNGVYKGYMEQAYADINTDGKGATGQTEDIPILLSQPSSWSDSDGTPEVAVGMYEAARDNANILLLGPKYHFSLGTQTIYSADGVHLGLNGANSGVNYRKLGALAGQAYSEFFDPDKSGTWPGFTVSSIVTAGNTATVCFNVPCELVGDCTAPFLAIDTTAVALADSSGADTYGWQIGGDLVQSRWVTSVSINGANSRCLDLVANDTWQIGSTIEYALHSEPDSHGGNGFSTLNYGSPRGNIRSTATTLDPHGGTQVHWLPHLRETVTTGSTPPASDGTLTADITWTVAWRMDAGQPGALCPAGANLTALYGGYALPWGGFGNYTCNASTGLMGDAAIGGTGGDEGVLLNIAGWNSSGGAPASIDSGARDDIWVRVLMAGGRQAATEYLWNLGDLDDTDDIRLEAQADGDLALIYSGTTGTINHTWEEILPLGPHQTQVDVFINKRGTPDGDMRTKICLNSLCDTRSHNIVGSAHTHAGDISFMMGSNNGARGRRAVSFFGVNVGEGASKFSEQKHRDDYDDHAPVELAGPIAPSGDLALVRSTFIGGGPELSIALNEEEGLRNCMFDSAGRIVLAGSSVSTTPVPGGAQTTWGGSTAVTYTLGDGWLGLMSADLSTLVAGSHFGGSGSERPLYNLARGENDAIYAGGHTHSTDLTNTAGGAQTTNGGGEDGFLVKFSSDLSTIDQATYWGGASGDKFRGSIYYRREMGDLVACGDFASGGLASTDALQPTNAGGNNEGGFGVFSKDLTSSYSFDYFGSSAAAATETIASCVPSGVAGIILAGTSPDDAFLNTARTNGATAGTGATTGNDGYVRRVFRVGDNITADWTVILGTGTTPTGADMFIEPGTVIDDNGDVYVVGKVTADGFQTLGTFGGSEDCFVAKVSGDGAGVDWLRVIGGAGDDGCTGASLDAYDNVIVAGQTQSSNLPVTDDAMYLTNAGGEDAFFFVLDPNGTVLYGTYFGGTAQDDFRWLCNEPGTASWVFVGQSASASVPGLDGTSYQQTNGLGLSDMLVSKFSNLPTKATPYYVLEKFERPGCANMATNLTPECDYTGGVLDGAESLRISNNANNERVAGNVSGLSGIGDDIWADFLIEHNSTTSSFVGIGFETINGGTSADTLIQFSIEAGQANIACRGFGSPPSATAVTMPAGQQHVTLHIDRVTGLAEGWLRADAGRDGVPDTERGTATWTVDCSGGAPHTAPVSWSTQAFSFPGTYDVVFDNLKIYDDATLAP